MTLGITVPTEVQPANPLPGTSLAELDPAALALRFPLYPSQTEVAL